MSCKFAVATIALAMGVAIAPASAQSTKPASPAAPSGVSKAQFLDNIDKEFSAMDANKDKKLSRQEIEDFRSAALAQKRGQRNKQMFAQLDTDKNGWLSPQEFARLAGGDVKVNAQALVRRIDANHDQQITQGEYRAGAEADFDRLDTNHDKILSPAEVRASARQRR